MAFTSYSCSDKEVRAGYAGEDLSGIARITRDKQTKIATFTIDVPGKWKLYCGLSVEAIDFSKPVLTGKNAGTYPLQVPDSVRSYFQLVTEKGKAILAERHLPMAGGFNFRDLGGFRTTEGRYVKWGKIIRSDDLYHLTVSDLRYLSSLPLTSIVDFRSEQEMNMAPDKHPETTTGYYPFPIAPGTLSDVMNVPADADQGIHAMKAVNVMLVSDSLSKQRYKDYFALLQSEKDVPLLFHCSAGKDRTGMAAALTLFALGVDKETIMEDYLASNIYLEDKYSKYTHLYPALKPLFEVNAEYIRSGIQWIRNEHGTVENYLTKELDVDIDKLKEMYLY